jgi:hypothetical protein
VCFRKPPSSNSSSNSNSNSSSETVQFECLHVSPKQKRSSFGIHIDANGKCLSLPLLRIVVRVAEAAKRTLLRDDRKPTVALETVLATLQKQKDLLALLMSYRYGQTEQSDVESIRLRLR